ncbi:MAG: vWA domain-containing protein [Armatimonadota bacterium]
MQPTTFKNSTFVIRLMLIACLLFLPLLVHAQDDISEAEIGEAAGPVRDLRAIKDKTVIFVFDVSGSMRGENLRRAREATVGILREGTGTGDRVVLFTFGAGYKKVFDKTLESSADKAALVEQVPSRPEEGAGTNIRRPHHEALKILEQTQPRPGAVILLTDSFNDEPRPTDPSYSDYLRYYTAGGQLNKYPNTPENRDYERLLQKLYRSRKIKAYGIGVQIDESGRPGERLPQAAPSVTSLPATPVVSSVVREEKPTSPLPWILLGAAALLALLAALLLPPLLRAATFRLTGGPAGPKDFSLKNGQVVRLGGKGASFAGDAYPLPGLDDPAAEIRAARGQLRLAPLGVVATERTPAAVPAQGGSNQNVLPRVFHNGLPLEKEEPLGYGDEIRVSVPNASGAGVPREFRLKLDDPRKTF